MYWVSSISSICVFVCCHVIEVTLEKKLTLHSSNDQTSGHSLENEVYSCKKTLVYLYACSYVYAYTCA